MKIKVITGIILIMLLTTIYTANGGAQEKALEIKKIAHGWYKEINGGGVYPYFVDTITQLCFFGATLIPCQNLKKRVEWKNIITW